MFNMFKNSSFESIQKELFKDNVDIDIIQKAISKGIDINTLDSISTLPYQ